MDTNGMNVCDVIAMTLYANDGHVTGRTVIQKLTYLWSVSISPINGIDFQPYRYGPYSPGLYDALTKMIASSFLNEEMKTGPVYSAYHYSLSDSGMKLAERAKNKHPGEFRKIEKIVSEAKNLFALRAYQLASATKIHYLQRQTNEPGNMDAEGIIKQASKLKWNMKENNITDGIMFLEKLDLMKSASVKKRESHRVSVI